MHSFLSSAFSLLGSLHETRIRKPLLATYTPASALPPPTADHASPPIILLLASESSLSRRRLLFPRPLGAGVILGRRRVTPHARCSISAQGANVISRRLLCPPAGTRHGARALNPVRTNRILDPMPLD